MSKGKILASALSIALSGSLLVGGTMAWQSLNQEALNEVSGIVNPGGRLHDDFNGQNKDVYVENFADEPIFARVRLDEFLQMYNGGREKKDTYIVGSRDDDIEMDIENLNSYITYKPLVSYDENGNRVMELINPDDPFRQFVDWDFSGETVYLPTFNMNKDSLEADVNGSIEFVDDGKAYADYKVYTAGEEVTGDEIIDNDVDEADEVAKAGISISDSIALKKLGRTDTEADYWTQIKDEFGDPNSEVTHESAPHIAKATPYATVITMQQWLDMDKPVGDFWVYDEDGWAYYAKPIPAPVEGNDTIKAVSGLLLDSISITRIDDDYDYNINVVAQFVTAGDVGEKDGTGFYDLEHSDSEPTADAVQLLMKLGAMESQLEITSTLNAEGTYDIAVTGAVGDVTYKVVGNTSANTVISDGVLTIADDEQSSAIVVVATDTITDVDGNVLGSKSVEIVIAYTPVVNDSTGNTNDVP